MACCPRICPRCKQNILRVGRVIPHREGRPALQCACGMVRLGRTATQKRATWVDLGVREPFEQQTKIHQRAQTVLPPTPTPRKKTPALVKKVTQPSRW